MDQASNLDLVYNLAQLLKEQVGATRRYAVETPLLALYDDDGNLVEAHDLKGEVKVTRLGDGMLVQGDVLSQVALQCSRCLDDFMLPVDARLEEQFQPSIDIESGHPIKRAEYEQDDNAFMLDPNHMMDLTEPIRQALLVALPMRPLCREDCKGLCSICGANRNYEDCGHIDEQTDSRWAGLRDLDLADFPADRNMN
ncbi:MAG: DUF177 domain-containing protein [Chloroflexia bacterium]